MSFPRHGRYKQCGVAGLREVPEHWIVTPVKRVIRSIESGTSVNGTGKPAEDDEMGVLTTSCIQAGRFEPGENKTVVPDDRHRASCPLKAGSLIVSRLSTIDLVGTAGYVGHAPANRFLPDRLWQVTFANANPRFVHHWTRSSWYRSQVDAAGTSVSPTMKFLSQAEFGSFLLAVPPLAEQASIVRFLDQETAKIDARVGDLRRLIALLHEKRLAVVARAVTKGLDPNVPMKRTGVDGIGEMPEHWELKAMRNIANVVRGASPRPAGDPRYFGGDAVPWVTVGEITRDDRMKLTETRTCLTEAGARRSRRFAQGTVVYSNSGDTLGVPKILGMDACANDGVAAFENLSPEVDPRFLCFFLGSITAAMREKAKQGSG